MSDIVCLLLNCFALYSKICFSEPSIIHVIFLNRTLRILFALGIFCLLLPIVDYFYFYSTEITEYQIDDSGICSHYPIYQIPCGAEVSDFFVLLFSFHGEFYMPEEQFNLQKIEKKSSIVVHLLMNENKCETSWTLIQKRRRSHIDVFESFRTKALLSHSILMHL